MAEVWYAENVIGKKAAVKILLPKFCVDETVVERFMTEAKVMVDLNHPNIRQVYDYSNIDNRPAIIMEYLEGDDLKARMKQGQRFTNDELVKWWNQLVDALKYTHEEGIVHRDIKPGNIFVDKKGNVKLLDFGIAKVRESISSTQTGQKLGTLMYMSPEQVRDSKHIDYHTDIYSLAVTFVHLLTGKKPYDSDTSSDYDIQTSIVTTPLDLSEVPEGWKGFLAPYLEKEPSKRPELKYYEAKPAEQSNSDDEETMVESSPKKPEHSESSEHAETSENSKKKSKLGLWIGLAVAAVAIGVIVVLNRPDKDTEWYNNCNSVADYRGYVSNYGKDGKHYNEAKSFIDRYVADSTNKAQKAQAEAEAKAKAKAEQEAKAKKEAEAKAKKEKEAQEKAEANAKKEAEAKAKKMKEDEAKPKKEAEAKAFTNKTFTVNGISFEMIAVKGGTFTMGGTSEQGSEAESDEKPTHSVTLSDYYIGKYEVTQELWQAVMGSNPSRFKGNNHPVEQVSWNDVQEFITKLNRQTGANFRLPTEAEWEYAARGGNKSNGYKYSGSNSIDNVAVYEVNSYNKGNNHPDYGTHAVGTKSPNELGIYDMSGNVDEWCQDWYGNYSGGSQTNPTGQSSGSYPVLRGGSWYADARRCRVSFRFSGYPGDRKDIHGFRLVLVP